MYSRTIPLSGGFIELIGEITRGGNVLEDGKERGLAGGRGVSGLGCWLIVEVGSIGIY